MESTTLTNEAYIAQTANMVSVAAHTGARHGTVEIAVNGRKVKRCKIYTTISCQDHEATAAAGLNYLKGRFATPTMIWVRPDGKELFRKSGFRPPEQMIQDLRQALEKLPGERISRKDYEPQGIPLEEGERAIQERQWKTAIEKLTTARKGRFEPLRRAAEKALDEVIRTGDQLLREGQAYLEAKDPASARPYFKLLADEFAELDCGRKGAEFLRQIGDEPKEEPR